MSTIYVKCSYLNVQYPRSDVKRCVACRVCIMMGSPFSTYALSHMTVCGDVAKQYSYFIARYCIFGMIVYVSYYFIRVISYVHVGSVNCGGRCMYSVHPNEYAAVRLKKLFTNESF